jgi:hypothetical protein
VDRSQRMFLIDKQALLANSPGLGKAVRKLFAVDALAIYRTAMAFLDIF